MPSARLTPWIRASSNSALWQTSYSRTVFSATYTSARSFSASQLVHRFSPELQRKIRKYQGRPAHVAQRHVDIARTTKFEYEPLPPDPDVLAALKDSNEDPLTIFEASVTRGTVTVATAERCLEKVLALHDDLSRQDTEMALRQKQVGANVLKWLWESSAQEARDFLHMPSTMLLLCDVAVREGNENFIWSWLQTESEGFDKFPDIKFWWRSFLLANLVQAKLNVPSDGTADGVIQSLLEVWSIQQKSDFICSERCP